MTDVVDETFYPATSVELGESSLAQNPHVVVCEVPGRLLHT